MILNIFANFWNEQSFICQIEFSRRLVQSMAIRRSFVFALTEIREFSSPMYEIRSDSKNNIFANVCVLGLTLERPSSFVLVEICQIAFCAHSPIVDNFSTELTLLWAKVVCFAIWNWRNVSLMNMIPPGFDFLAQSQVQLRTMKTKRPRTQIVVFPLKVNANNSFSRALPNQEKKTATPRPSDF